jgi:hypothetical protein
MIDFIIWVALASAWCWGFSNAFDDGEIFGKAGDWLDEKLPKMLNKPLWSCPKCMPSVHGTIWFLISNQSGFIMWILFIVSVSGVNTIIYKRTKDE